MKINILILGMFLTVNAYATICEFDGNDKCYVPQSFLFKQDPLILQEAIKDFRNLSDYPSLGNGPIDKKNCQLPEENSKLEEVFNQLESHFSKGRSAFKIMTCDSHRKVSFSSYDKTVYFSDELLKKIEESFKDTSDLESVLGFIIAHELNHYMTDYYLIHSSNRMTPLENPDIRNVFFRLQVRVYGQGFDSNTDLGRKYLKAREEELKSHSEVDLAGLVLMKSAGLKFNKRVIVKMLKLIQGDAPDLEKLKEMKELECMDGIEFHYRQENISYYSNLIF